jgi:hypothetical protein
MTDAIPEDLDERLNLVGKKLSRETLVRKQSQNLLSLPKAGWREADLRENRKI